MLAPVARRVRRLQFIDRDMAAVRYRACVRGGTVVVAPKNISGEFEISATSDIACRVVVSGYYEPDVTTALEDLQLKEGTIVNVGANVGFYAAYLARRFVDCKKVLAIEPNPEAFRQLESNIRRNGLSGRVEPLQMCIGDSEGLVDFSLVEGMSEYSSIGHIAHPRVAGERQVTGRVKISSLGSIMGRERVALIFVDTEGAEQLVFRGAREILIRDKPILFFECSNTLLRNFHGSTRDLEGQLQALGYVVRNGLCRRLSLQHPYEGEALAVHRDDLSETKS